MKKLIGTLMALALAAGVSFGAAATAAVDTPKKAGIMAQFGVYTNTRIWAGTMVALNSSGYAVPAADTSGYIVIGRAAKTVDNRTGQTGAGDSGALTIDVERGVFGWTGRGISSDTAVGSICYVSDDNSVTNGAGDHAIIAGVVVDYSDGKVWVDTYNIGRTVGSFTTLTATGATALGATTVNGSGLTVTNNLAVSKNAAITGTLGVTSTSSLGALTTTGTTTLGGTTVSVTNNATVAGTLGVTGTATLPTITGLGKVFKLITLTNLVHNGGAETGNVVFVSYTP
jgi:hypothetical protein